MEFLADDEHMSELKDRLLLTGVVGIISDSEVNVSQTHQRQCQTECQDSGGI